MLCVPDLYWHRRGGKHVKGLARCHDWNNRAATGSQSNHSAATASEPRRRRLMVYRDALGLGASPNGIAEMVAEPRNNASLLAAAVLVQLLVVLPPVMLRPLLTPCFS